MNAPVRAGTGDAVTGWASETFASVQGEGVFVGQPQVFLRTAGCHETCRWCDTLYAKVRPRRFVVRASGGVRTHVNPVPAHLAAGEAAALARAAGVRTVSLTGGEPLEQPGFARALARALRAQGLGVHLETAGLDAHALASIRSCVDVVAMDVKLPSATGRPAWAAHARFLETAVGDGDGPDVFVKVVVDLDARADEVERAARLVAGVSRRVPLVVQPESGVLLCGGPAADALIDHAARLADAARAHLDAVRVVPQCHRIVGVR